MNDLGSSRNNRPLSLYLHKRPCPSSITIITIINSHNQILLPHPNRIHKPHRSTLNILPPFLQRSPYKPLNPYFQTHPCQEGRLWDWAVWRHFYIILTLFEQRKKKTQTESPKSFFDIRKINISRKVAFTRTVKNVHNFMVFESLPKIKS